MKHETNIPSSLCLLSDEHKKIIGLNYCVFDNTDKC